MTPNLTVLIVAGGQGTRMGLPLPKQYLPLAGQPVLSHTLKTFDRMELISRMVLVVPVDDGDYCRDQIIPFVKLTKPLTLAIGGTSRQESVRNGLIKLDDPGGFVAIHDAVRPFVPLMAVKQCFDAAQKSGAAILAMPCVETLKQSSERSTIEKTVSRQDLWLAQTPQIFKVGIIQKAHQEALAMKFAATDDAQLIERMGLPVAVVPGSRTNIKITTPEDLVFAEKLIEAGVLNR